MTYSPFTLNVLLFKKKNVACSLPPNLHEQHKYAIVILNSICRAIKIVQSKELNMVT